jgi:CheY-like chemotaxis protein/glycine cleavage system H lipoate-binding protein
MVIAIVIVTFVVFVVVDLLLRIVLRRLDETKRRKERQEALDIGLRVDVSPTAPSLKSVSVKDPKARILAVDDESIILDSFRKILVLAGYSIDTVESGPEALGLIQKNDYDFVFTDLKMPDFDGLEVTKAVKHLRPDIDMVIITGYATVESAVDAMKFGALDYVQKPFTEDELVAFANRTLLRRQARLELERPPMPNLVTASSPESRSERVFNIPAGLFISPAHVWVRIELNGELRAGIDDFARKTIGRIDGIVLPRTGRVVKRGDTLFSVTQGSRTMEFPSPVEGRVSAVNDDIESHPEHVEINPYDVGWLCRVEANSLSADLESMRIGADAVDWYRQEIERLGHLSDDLEDEGPSNTTTPPPPTLSDAQWNAFSSSFLGA